MAVAQAHGYAHTFCGTPPGIKYRVALPQGSPQLHSQRQAGFIITLELVLITTILVIGSIVGLAAIRDALIKQYAHRESLAITVYDASGVRLGRAIGYDEHEAPLIPYVDRTVPPLAPDPAHRNYRALLGIRDDRFTSREAVYYDGPACTGTPCLKISSDEASDSAGITGAAATGAVGYLYALQNGPVYAVGASPDGIKGHLYRSRLFESCPVQDTDFRSRYLSQKVVSGSPCEALDLRQTNSAADTTCLVDIGDACACDQGFGSQGDVLDTFDSTIDETYRDAADDLVKDLRKQINGIAPKDDRIPKAKVGEVCCPTGTRLRDDGNLVNSLTYALINNVLADGGIQGGLIGNQIDLLLQPFAGELICESGAGGNRFLAADSVPDPDDSTRNTLERFNTPFRVNLPIDRGENSWISTTPDGEG